MVLHTWVMVAVVMSVCINRGSKVVHLVDATALWATLEWTVVGYSQPGNDMGVHWASSAAKVLLLTIALNSDGILKSSCVIQRSIG